MSKVFSVNCNHVVDIKPGGKEYYHFVVTGDDYNVKCEKDWKFCPVCGKAVEFALEEKNEK